MAVAIVDEVEMESFDDEHNNGGSENLLAVTNSKRKKITVQRDLLNEADFEEGFHPIKSTMKKNWYKSFIPPEPICSSLLPPTSKHDCKLFLFTHLPIFGWLWNYQPKFLVGDIIAGITVAIMRIPQGLAYAQLAGLPPVYGLYASFVPVIVYSIFGTSKHISVGTFAVVSLMVSNAITRVFESDGAMMDCLTDNDTTNIVVNVSGRVLTCSELTKEIATTLSFVSGLIMLFMGIFQLGFVTIFLSESLISGYTTGAAVHVFTSQLKHIFGLQIPSIRGLLNVPKTWIEVIKAIINWPDNVNTAAFIISVLCIIALIVFRIVDRKLLRKLKVPCFLYSRYSKKWTKRKFKWPIPLPSQLIVVIVAAGISYGVNLSDRYQVKIIDNIPPGLPGFTPPKPSYFLILLPEAFVISIVTFVVTVSIAQVFAKKFAYSTSPNQELAAYGAMNLLGSMFSGFNTAGGLSRSTVQAVSGGKTQLVGFISTGIILIVLVALSDLFEPLPNAVLASIIWVALYGMFTQVIDLWRYFKLSLSDMFIWIVVFLATVLLGVDLGLVVGILFSLFVIVFNIILPNSSVLGRAKDTEIFRNVANFEMVESVPGVVIYRFQAPLCFVNCKVFQSRLDLVCGIDRTQLEDADKPGCIQVLMTKCCCKEWKQYNVQKKAEEISDVHSESGTTRQRIRSIKDKITDTLAPNQAPVGSIHTVILDCSPVTFMDAMGVKTLQQLVLDFDLMGVQVIFAALTKTNRDMLERVGFFEICGKEWLFPSVQDAVNHALLGSKLHPGDKEDPLQQDNNLSEDTGVNHNSSREHTITISVNVPPHE